MDVLINELGFIPCISTLPRRMASGRNVVFLARLRPHVGTLCHPYHNITPAYHQREHTSSHLVGITPFIFAMVTPQRLIFVPRELIDLLIFSKQFLE